MKLSGYLIVILAILLRLPAWAQGKENKVADTSRHGYIFTPQTVYPSDTRPRPVTAGFELKILPDTVACYLPYFGRAYSPDYYSRKSTTDFTSSDFQYEESNKKDETTIIIIPRDNKDVKTIRLVYYKESPYANVYITFNRQQAIEYRGMLKIIPIE